MSTHPLAQARRLLETTGTAAVVDLPKVPAHLATAGFTTYLYRTPETAVAVALTADNLTGIADAVGGQVAPAADGGPRLRFPTIDHRGHRQLGTARPGDVLVRIDERYLDPKRGDRRPVYIARPRDTFADHWYAPGHTDRAGSPTHTPKEG